MDTEEFARRLAAFDAAVTDGPYPAPEPGEWSVEMVLAHAATVNHLVALSVTSVIGGEAVAYSNRLAGSEPLLRALVAEAGGVAELKAEVLRTGRVLVRLAGELGPDAATPIQTWIAEGETVHVDGPVPAMAIGSTWPRSGAPPRLRPARRQRPSPQRSPPEWSPSSARLPTRAAGSCSICCSIGMAGPSATCAATCPR